MSYKYTITQEESTLRTKLTYEFSANDEDDLVEELNCFIRSIGYTESGYLTLVNEDDCLHDDLESEVEQSVNYRNPEVEGFMNFEFAEEGQGQTDYNFTAEDVDTIADKASFYQTPQFPFPLDRPSQPTYRVDSGLYSNTEYQLNKSSNGYYGA